jgi:hypothetical protein
MEARPTPRRPTDRAELTAWGIIPADARVDPAGFPDKSFPVLCPDCRYLLRGLSGNACPECGGTFDRGRLLVEQYVMRPDTCLFARHGRLGRLLLAAGLVISIGSLGFLALMNVLVTKGRAGMLSGSALGLYGTCMLCGVACSSGTAWLQWRNRRRIRDHSRQVAGAIDRESPSVRLAEERVASLTSGFMTLVAVPLIAAGALRLDRGAYGVFNAFAFWMGIALLIVAVITRFAGRSHRG